MRTPAPFRAVVGLGALLLLGSVAPLGAQSAPPAVASFDSAWSAIRRTHFDTAFNGVDWDAVRAELRPRALAATGDAGLRTVVGEMLGRLHQSHFYLIPREAGQVLSVDGAATDGDAGMDVRLVEGRLLVAGVRPAGAADRAGIRPGWAVERVAALEAPRLLGALRGLGPDPRTAELRAWMAVRAALGGSAGMPLTLRVADADGHVAERTLVLDRAPGEVTRFGNLPAIRVVAESGRRVSGGRSVGVIRFNYWLPALARQLDEAVNGLRDADGIVLDLRGNLGGAGGMAMGIAGHFLDRPDTLGVMRMRTATLQFVANPRRVTAAGERVRPFAGPLAILTDATTASTSEIFAAGLQRLGRARVFGTPSAGQALPAFMTRLPNGDVLVHAVADFTLPGGARLEGIGVVPDVRVQTTRAGLLAGRDEALEAALAWIAGEPKP